MNFYISQIKLWFKNGYEPRTFEFYNDTVNVITGASSTGKSSLLRIIDYCLLRETCNIVEDVINSSVAWYGMLFYVDDKPYTIIRKAPVREIPEMVVIYREDAYLPDTMPIASEEDIRASAFVKLNELLGFKKKMKLEGKIVATYRHFLIFNYLTEDIIATENTYQDVRFFHDQNIVRLLDALFKLVIGVNEALIRKLEEDLNKAKILTNRKKKSQQKELKEVEDYRKRREQQMHELVNLGICGDAGIYVESEECLNLLNETVENYKIQFNDEKKSKKRCALEKEIQDLNDRIGYYTSLEREFKVYVKRQGRRKDSLEPMEFIEKHLPEVFRYNETGFVLGKLKEAWLALRDAYDPSVELPADFQQRKQSLLSLLSEKKMEFDKLNPMQPQTHSMQWVRKVILLAEQIKNDLQKTQYVSIKDEDILALKDNETKIAVNLEKLRIENANASGCLDKYIEKYFRYQDSISESYKDCVPMYSVEHHSLFLGRDGWDYPIENVGSKSNYMFMHLCYFFGLHELLSENANKNVLPFLFIDQPSIPYYGDRKNDGSELKSDDATKLHDAFRLIDKFMEERKIVGKHFQIIMVEHADPDYWKLLENFTTTAVFERNNGLIPQNAIVK